MRIVEAYKTRFPNWRHEKIANARFLTQYVEMIVAESSVLHESDGVMMSEDRYVLEMAKPEHGGVSAAAARARFLELLGDKTSVTDRKKFDFASATC